MCLRVLFVHERKVSGFRIFLASNEYSRVYDLLYDVKLVCIGIHITRYYNVNVIIFIAHYGRGRAKTACVCAEKIFLFFVFLLGLQSTPGSRAFSVATRDNDRQRRPIMLSWFSQTLNGHVSFTCWPNFFFLFIYDRVYRITRVTIQLKLSNSKCTIIIEVLLFFTEYCRISLTKIS